MLETSIHFETKTFAQLTSHELYTVLALRNEVFIVEQNCPYQDIDAQDDKALHVLCIQDGMLVAYARLFDANDYYPQASIGRVIVKQQARGKGYGHLLMHYCIQQIQERFGCSDICIGAQKYLQGFYQKHGFVVVGDGYMEDGIPHLQMHKN